MGNNEYFDGESFGWADVAVAPFVHWAHFYGDDMASRTGSNLGCWHTGTLPRPSIKETFVEMEAAAKVAAAKVSATALSTTTIDWISPSSPWAWTPLQKS